MSYLFCFYVFLLGGCVASFINCLFYRRNISGDNWIVGRSKCSVCGHILGFIDLIPIFSCIIFKARCRKCHTYYGWYNAITEFIVGFITIFIYLFYDSNIASLFWLFLFYILYALLVHIITKYECKIINKQ